jgi:hypothetical protein
MAFGRPDEPLHRSLSDYKRKPIDEISEGTDPRLEAARLAPSGLNRQLWYFIADNGLIHCFMKKPFMGIMKKVARIDMGIAICHIMVDGGVKNFVKDPEPLEKKGYIYVGTVR